MLSFFKVNRIRARFLLLLFSPAVLLSCIGQANAQGGVGSTRGLPESAAGIHSIQGRVYLPSGRRAGTGIVVSLEGNVNGRRTAVTDADGGFSFNGLPAAEYQLVIQGGPEYDGASQTVTIYGTTGNVGVGRAAQTIALDVHLIFKGATIDEAKLFVGVPKEAVDNYKAAAKAAQNGNSKKAVEQLNAALAIHPTFTLALTELGVQYLKLGEMAKLAETMESLLKLSPDDPHAHLNLGIALYNQKKFPEAEAHLRRTIELKNGDPAAHYYLGMTLVSLRQFQEAETELELAIKNGGDNLALAHKYLGGLYWSSKKNQQAIEEFEKYLKLEPKATDAPRIKKTIEDLRSKQ